MDPRALAIRVAQWVIAVSVLAVPVTAQADWSTIAEGKTSYTTDVFQFSAALRQRVSEDPSQPTVVPLEKPEDVVWEPSLEVIRSGSSRLGPTELSFKAHGFVYTDHPIFNHGNYRAQLKQSLASGTSVLLRYRYVPNLFLGPNVERRTGTFLTQDERVTSHIWRLQLERRLTEAWTFTLIGRYGLRLYNSEFAERDTRFWTLGPQIEYAVTSKATATLGYLYERGLADGAGDTRLNDDISYRQHVLSVGTGLQLSPPLSLTLLYIYRRKDFTSELVGDPHLNRQDLTHQGAAELRYRLTPAISLTFGFLRTQRTSTNALRDFIDTIYSLGGQYRF